MRGRWFFVGSSILMMLMVVGAAGGSTLWPFVNTRETPGDAAPRGDTLGNGESLVVVVVGFSDSIEEVSPVLEGFSLGTLDGFHLDESANYELLGLYGTREPRVRRVPCSQMAFGLDEGCDEGAATAEVLDISRLFRVAVQAAPQSRAAPNCEGLECMGAATLDLVASLATAESATPNLLELTEKPYLALTAFRTKRGAEEFLSLLRSMHGHQVLDKVAVLQVRKTGGIREIGLGQEPHPDGSGPLSKELPNQAEHQG